MWQQTLFLATEGAEGVAPSHIAAKIALPLGLLIFCGSVFLLLWSNFGIRKGGLIYGVSFFGFCFVIGVFWWFGAPGTPVATGLQNFPGQAADAYQAQWYPFEPGSERATFFPQAEGGDLDGFQSPAEYLGKAGTPQEDLEADPQYAALVGDLDQARATMVETYLKVDESGAPRLGGELRAQLQEEGEKGLQAAVDDPDAFGRADPFLTVEADDGIQVVKDQDVRVAGADLTVYANYIREDGTDLTPVPVGSQVMYAFQKPSLIWFPSAVWTVVSLLLFVLCLFALDRIEQREKREVAEVDEPERLAVPIRQ